MTLTKGLAMGWPEAVGGAIPRAAVRFIDWQTGREERKLRRSAERLAARFASRGMNLTANEILVEVGLEPRRWS